MRTPGATPAATLSKVVILRGRDAILPYQSMFEELAARFGQATAMHGLAYYFSRPENLKKTPYMVVVSAVAQPLESLDPRHIVGAAMLYSYRVLGRETGVLLAGDWSGHRSLIAEPAQREYVTSQATDALLRNGARFILCTFQQEGEQAPAVNPESKETTAPAYRDLPGSWAIRSRVIPDHLPLLASYDETLATVGKRTRHNLRLFRKRIETHVACEYIPDATSIVRPDELAPLNASSINPIPQSSFDLQWNSCMNLQGGFISGLRTADGTWLSIAGGWRQGTTTVLQWQMNRGGFEKFSLSVAARAFLLEHEIERGQTIFRIEGGTPHSLSHSFNKARAVDLIVRKRWSPALAAIRLAARMWQASPMRKTENFLMDTLGSRSLVWNHPTAASARQRPEAKTLRTHTP